MDLKQMEWKDINWIYLTQAKDEWWVGCCEHGKKPSSSTPHRVFLDKQRTISISREALLHDDG